MSGSLRRTAKPAPPAEVRIGAKLRAARLAAGLTIEKVADAAGLTKGFVSRLERDEVSPSVASLVAVCAAIGLRVGALFEPPRTAVVRSAEKPRINFGGRKVKEYLLTPGTQQHLEVIHSLIGPGGTGGTEAYTLDCDAEFVYVIAGRLEVLFAGETIVLEADDSLTFPGREPHTWRNASQTEPCQVLWILAPAP
ncbi:MAG TPA: XRE family transcriptional regulator [Jiangellales bacterium]|nr:XRE family transcriptional regulator [Jiangellales bacterium]